MITKANIKRLLIEGKLQQFDQGKWYDMVLDTRVPVRHPLEVPFTARVADGIFHSYFARQRFDDYGVFHDNDIRIKPGVI